MLFGGAAGGGKSISLLAAALQFVPIRGYSALLLRRTYADLNLPKALIPLSHMWLGGTNAAWNGQKYQWAFPSGATLSFGYLATENDKYRYQGSEFQYIGFDELTQFSATSYAYMQSRLRKTESMAAPLRCRSASNPGGTGNAWVKDRFIDPPSPTDCVFVPSKLEDNPYLDRAEYEESLAALDPTTRRQLRHGDWNVTAEAGIFRREWLRHYRIESGFYLLGPKRVRKSDCSRFATVDCAGTSKYNAADPDYTVCCVWDATADGDMILVDMWRGQVEIPEAVDAIMGAARRYDVPWVGIEKNGLGLGVVQTARKLGLTVRPMLARAGVDKVARSQVLQIRMEQGSVWFPAGLEITGTIEAELLGFPTVGMHDDIVDCCAWAAQMVQKIYGPLHSSTEESPDPPIEPLPVPQPVPVYSSDDESAWLSGN